MHDHEDATFSDRQKGQRAFDGGRDPLAAYLELALKIYLRLKKDGRSIHSPEIDDETDRLYDHPADR